ncbi:MAG: peptidoglycan-binding protein [Pseudomonadota bacterium]
MSFKRTTDGRVFFSGSTNETANDEDAPVSAKPEGSAVQKQAPKVSEPTHVEKPSRSGQTQVQVLQLLKSLNERLKTTQAERNFMRRQLEEYRGVIEGLQKQTGDNEKAYKALEDKIVKGLSSSGKSSDSAKTEEFIRDTLKEMEKTRRALLTLESKTERADQAVLHMKQSQQAQAQKLAKTGSEYTKISHRLAAQEEKQNLLNERIDGAIARQEKIAKRIDDAIEERERFMRKIERIEETVLQTRDALNARAMMLMADPEADIEDTKSLGQSLQLQNQQAAEKYEQAEIVSETAPERKPEFEGTHFSEPNPLDEPVQKPSSFAQNNQQQERYEPKPSFARPSWLTAETALIPGMFFVAVAAGLFIGATTSQDGVKRPQYEQISTTIEQTDNSAKTEWSIEKDTSAFNTPAEAVPESAPVRTQEQAPEEFPRELKELGIESDQQMVKMFEDAPEELGETINKVEPGNEDIANDNEDAVNVPPAQPEKTVVIEAPVETKAEMPVPEIVEAVEAPVQTEQTLQPDPNLPEAIKKVEKQAFAGSPEAQHDLAAIYIAGHAGVTQNYKRAITWFERAADQGIANAGYNLGVLYHQGLGVQSDLDEAILWYKKAAALNHPEAQYNLGIAYIEGIGVPYQPQQAVTYFKQAAENGVIEASYNLGLIFENGLLGEPQPKDALMWYKAAADAGNTEAQTALELLAKAIGVSLDEVNRVAEDAVAPNVSVPQQTQSAPAESVAQNVSETDALAEVEKEFEQILTAQIQEQLMRLGLYPGPADGITGPLTTDAIRTYQDKNDLRVDGQVTASLLEHMTETAAGNN